MIVEKGKANVAVVDELGNSPLDVAEQNNMSEVAVYLWEHGCESAAFHQASDIGRMQWSRPYIIDPPSGRFGASCATFGSRVLIYGGNGIPRNAVMAAPEVPINQAAFQTAPLSDMYLIDFDEVKVRNLCYPEESPIPHRAMTLSLEQLGPDILLHDDMLTIESQQPPMDCLPSAVKSSVPYRMDSNGLCYFETTIVNPGTRRIVSIGLTDAAFPVHKKHAGWLKNTYGLHGDDGSLFHASGHGRPHGPRFEAGDIIGCGINFATQEVFFTRNGDFLGVAYKAADCKELWPTCALRNPLAKVKFNFGAAPFRFDFRVRTYQIPSLAQPRLTTSWSMSSFFTMSLDTPVGTPSASLLALWPHRKAAPLEFAPGPSKPIRCALPSHAYLQPKLSSMVRA